MSKPLEGKTGVVFGVANKRSIAWGIAQAWHEAGARLAFTYQGERLKEKVEKLVSDFGGGTLVTKCDVSSDADIDRVFGEVGGHFNGKLDMLLHSVAFAPREALEASTRYLAADLGEQKIRVNCISAGPVNTLAARGIAGFSGMLKHYEAHAPLRRNVSHEELGQTGVFLASDGGAAITGQVLYVDCGYQIMGGM